MRLRFLWEGEDRALPICAMASRWAASHRKLSVTVTAGLKAVLRGNRQNHKQEQVFMGAVLLKNRKENLQKQYLYV